MQVKTTIINMRKYLFRNYGDGWDVYYVNGTKPQMLEEGCYSFEDAYNIAAEDAYDNVRFKK